MDESDESDTEPKSLDEPRSIPEGSESVPVVVEEGCSSNSGCNSSGDFARAISAPTPSMSVGEMNRPSRRLKKCATNPAMESCSVTPVCSLREDPNSMQNVVRSSSSPNFYGSPSTGLSAMQPVLENAPKRTPTRIAVSGLLHSDDNEKRLRQYFQSKSKSGGDENIKEAYWTRDDNNFVIEFSSSDPVDGILAKQHTGRHKLCSCELDVRVLEPPLDNSQLGRAFCVHNTAEDVCTLNNYLNHLGVKSAWHHDISSNQIVVCVPSLQDMMKVLKLDEEDDSQKVVRFDGRNLTVVPLFPVDCSTWVEGDVERHVVYATHLSRDETEDDLLQYFVQGSEQGVSKVKMSTTCRPRALILFNSPVDFHQLRRWVHEQPLKGRMIGVERVPVTSRIRVSNLHIEENHSEQTREDLSIHFSRIADRCGPHDNIDVELLPAQRCAVVNFHSREVLDHVRQDPECSTNELFKCPLVIELDFDV